MKTAAEIQDDLRNFTGTEEWTRYSPHLFPNVLLTDGTKYVAEECGAYWLMDAISSHLPAVSTEPFVVVVLEKNSAYHGGWTLLLVDDIPSRTIFARQEIAFSDFPLDEIKLYAIRDADYWVILLPSEY